MKRYFELLQDGKTAELNIYGDIVADGWCWSEADMSAHKLSKMLEDLEGVEQINVRINSFGGDVAEGLAIYNALRRHSARVTTTCDGFACSIASVIFMAGDERVMSHASLLMIHNAWEFVGCANADDMRKYADDLDKITQASKNAYMSHVSITEDELSDMMDAETWITPAEALEMGFSTRTEAYEADSNPSQGARQSLYRLVTAQQGQAPDEPAEPEPADPEPEEAGIPEEEPSEDGAPEGEPEDGEEEPKPGEGEGEYAKKQAAEAAFFMGLAEAIEERGKNANEG